MCVSLRPAHFSQTKGLCAEARLNGRTVHLLGYQNTVSNLVDGAPAAKNTGSDFGWKRGTTSTAKAATKGTGNAMLLPIPAVPGTMNELNVIDTSSAPSCLLDMEKAIQPVTRGGIRRGGLLGGNARPDSVTVFDHDIYTVVLASNAKLIPKALALVPADKRPPVNKEIFDAYAKWYPDWTFAFCCFNTKDEASAKPLLWWYVPQHPEFLFFPALDGHDGKAPNLEATVDVDHAIMVSSNALNANKQGTFGNRVSYSDQRRSDQLQKLLPTYVLGQQFNTQLTNGDFLFQVSDVDTGVFNSKRELPPGAQEVAKPAPQPAPRPRTRTRRGS